MNKKKRILLKLTGKILIHRQTGLFTLEIINTIVQQLKQLQKTHQFGLVIGGGNLFRGKEQGQQLGITPSVGHHVGMLATIMNGLIITDLFEKHGLATTHFCALTVPEIAQPISHDRLHSALQNNNVLIFSGGTGNPFFTTDTTAVLRGLQIDAEEIWKGTNIDGIYEADPRIYPDAKLIKSLTYEQALEKKLGILDTTAYALAQQHQKNIRVFTIFAPDALLKAAQDTNFGSTINYHDQTLSDHKIK